MIKLINISLLSLALIACGSDTYDTDFTPVISTPVPAITNPTSVGNCVDYEPYNDGIGWNGLAECTLPVTTLTPISTVNSQFPNVAGVYSCDTGLAGGTSEIGLNADGSGYEYQYVNLHETTPHAQGKMRSFYWAQPNPEQINIGTKTYEYIASSGDFYLGPESCTEIVAPFNVEEPVCVPSTEPGRERFGWNGVEACVLPYLNQHRGWPRNAARITDRPVYECSHGDSSVWYWVFNTDGTIEDLKGANAGVYSTFGSAVSITNENNEFNQWQQVGKDLSVSWGNCQALTFEVSGWDTSTTVSITATPDSMLNTSYTCGQQGSSYAQQRILDGFGRWTGTLYQSGTAPVQNSGTYKIINDRIWFDHPAQIYTEGGYFTIGSDLVLTPQYGSTLFCV